MNGHRDDSGRYTRDDAQLRDALLELGHVVSLLMIRLDTDQGIDTADLVEALVPWRDATEDIDTRRGQADEGDA